MKNNNLFSFATKELSQDAVIAWLINKSCVDTNESNDIGKNFLCSLLDWKDEEKQKFEIINVIRQYKSIDVFVEIKVADKLEAVIIEDKTDTFLHDFQMIKYIGKIAEEKVRGAFKYNKIHFVLVKTGSIPKLEKVKFQFEKDLISDLLKRGQIKKVLEKIEEQNVLDTDDFKFKLSNESVSENILKSIENFSENKKESIVIYEIYQKYMSSINSIKSNDEILKYYQEYLKEIDTTNNVQTWLDKNYSDLCSELDNKNLKYYFDKPQSSGGKRSYECCVVRDDFINYKENAESITENFCVLPIIVFGENEISFQVNYSLIADVSKVHGYVPYDKIKETNLREKYNSFKTDVLDKNISESEYKAYKTQKSKNKLCFMKWRKQYNSTDNTIDFKNEVTTMLKCAEFIKNQIGNYNQ